MYVINRATYSYTQRRHMILRIDLRILLYVVYSINIKLRIINYTCHGLEVRA